MAAANVIVEVHGDLHITPIRKRKRMELTHPYAQVIREANAPQTPSCFTNKAFSSTPKKFGNKKNGISSAMEGACALTPINPYEVTRKPPKKKKRLEQGEEAACFENQGLNLDLPEKKFNPYEVIRTPKPLSDKNCFINAALNLKIQDSSTLANPFEIPRCDNDNHNNKEVGHSNETPFTPCKLQIGLPFVPTTQCRIDFQNVSLTQLIPSKLLADKLVFSPVLMNNFQRRESLDVIKEESSTDIDKELDCYQLELENSINEAKLRKNDNSNKIEKIEFHRKLGDHTEIIEAEQNVTGDIIREKNQSECKKEEFSKKEICNEDTLENIQIKHNDNNNPFLDNTDNVLSTSDKSLNMKELNDLYGDAIDEEILSDNDTPPKSFVRNYRKTDDPVKDYVIATNNHNNKSGNGEQQQQPHKKITTMLRKSIRKLIPHNKQMEDTKKKTSTNSKNFCSNVVERAKDGCDAKIDIASNTKHVTNQSSNGIINTIRQSLRRHKKSSQLQSERPSPVRIASPVRVCDDKNILPQPSLEVSIIDKTERVMKLKSNLSKTEYMKIEELTNERKLSLRSSFQRSSHLMKTVFHKKHEEYEFHK